MELSDTLIRPILTEKSTSQLTGDNTYTFEVGIDSNKIQIKNAVKAFFDVDVVQIRTAIVRGKVKRHGRHFGKRRNWKKAYVTLASGQSLNIYGA